MSIRSLRGRLHPYRACEAEKSRGWTLSPEIIAEYAAKWSAGRPSDAVCIADFQIKHRFTAPAAKSFLQVFDEAMWFVAGGATGVVAAVAPAPSPSSSIRIGDFVRIPTDGDQYPGGRRVVWLADGGRYLYVEKTPARYPVQAITRIGASPSAPGPNSDPGQSVLFPGIELPDALGYVQKIVDAAGREWVPIVEAANLWFGAPLLARTKQAAAGLCDYGFAEQQGRGQWHRLRLTELGWRAITQAGSTAGVLAVQEGISRSRLIVHYARQWQDRRPATVPAIKQVQREQGFSRKQAERFLAVFDQCFQFLRIR